MFTQLKDFYPTPENIISKMFSGLDFSMIKSILEPSAGDGKIVEALKKKKKYILHLIMNILLILIV